LKAFEFEERERERNLYFDEIMLMLFIIVYCPNNAKERITQEGFVLSIDAITTQATQQMNKK
jgi:hypothetical protein